MYDVIGIGIGPYNLGLAGLIDQTDEVDGIFFDDTPKFEWHPGMLVEKMDLQVPFMADLATFADPKSPYTFMNYLYENNRMFAFYLYQNVKIPRQEYNDYLQWVAGLLDNLSFGSTVVDVLDRKEEEYYTVRVEDKMTGEITDYDTKHIVMATGTEPLVLDGMEHFPNEDVLHSSRYLFEKEQLLKSKDVTVVGSGQSALEIFLDLLEEQERQDMNLTLLTRSGGLFQLDQAKFAQEMFTPEYIDYFHALSEEKRTEALGTLKPLRKGIDPDTLTRLYRKLYHRTAGGEDSNVFIQPMTEVNNIAFENGRYHLDCYQWQEEEPYVHSTKKVVLATGYEPSFPDWFLQNFEDKIEWEEEKQYKVTRDYKLVFKEERSHQFFTATGLTHSHGTGATNLGLAVHRNVHILNAIAGKEVYRNQENPAFQTFSVKDL
ncbi:lysine N(6)-hydroxylase/L-ornithine N(5)-oxygenase family protein [Salimicrobium halophilum]|uniref:L-lysine N6-monooxygenase MbtG n=1 Tax=Salimicrobium halophilum TaxID=86666 RepID=A0A1G8UN41_9BACI|nr:SidA/IucD/PvdA family monooxygenase [Salimicrobium halophilum]SDJ55252.1 lysine N6-hydroxylase [Salimicrobium halophilum]